MAGATEVLVQSVHPVEVTGVPLPKPGDRRERGPVDRADHPQLGVERETRQAVSARRSGVHGGREQPRPAVGVRQDGVQQPLADAASLMIGRHTVGRQVPEAVTILRDRETDDIVLVRRYPTASRIDVKEEPHPIDPLLRDGRRARLYLRFIDSPAAPIRLEKRCR
jgi:hypothetical protein